MFFDEWHGKESDHHFLAVYDIFWILVLFCDTILLLPSDCLILMKYLIEVYWAQNQPISNRGILNNYNRPNVRPFYLISFYCGPSYEIDLFGGALFSLESSETNWALINVPIPGKIKFIKRISAQEPHPRCLPTFSIVSAVILPILLQHPSF